MPARVSPTEAIRAEIDELFGSGREVAEVLEEVMRLSARLVLQQVLEDEVTSWLGRSWNSRSDGERAGQRNGYSDLTIKTTAGPVELRRPKLRNTTERFASSLLGVGVVRSEPLEALVISAWVRGLSDRDIEALLAEALGPEAALSKSTASRVCQRLRDEFETFRTRDLSGIELDYLFLDGSHFRMHDGSRAEPVLVAYGITTVGQPVLLAVEPGGDESHDAWAGFLDDLTARGLRPPLLVISDGAPGLLGAIDTKMAGALRQRCLIHRASNVLNCLPKSAQPGAKAALAEIWNAEDRDHAEVAAQVFAAEYGTKWPKVAAKITDDLDVLLAFYDYPAEHWIHLRTTNPIESTFATVRLRQRVTRGPGSRAAGVAMAFKLIESAQARWRAVNAPHLVALVRAGAKFEKGKLVERDDEQPDNHDQESGGDAHAA